MPKSAAPRRALSKKQQIAAGLLPDGTVPLIYKSSRRGRPRKPVSPDVLLPLVKHETAAMFDAADGGHQPKKTKTAKGTGSSRRTSPVTCDQHYSPEEIEFMNALDAYKRSSGHRFPTCSEILAVLKGLGYEKCLQGNSENLL